MATTKTTAERVTHASLAAALAAFQSEVPTIRKGNTAAVASKTGASYKYQYADLSDVTERTLPLLGKHGLSFMCLPMSDDSGSWLKYELRHESGESVADVYPLPDARRTPPQQLGSAITYARRYILTAITGVAPGGDDDDAQQAQQYHQQAPQQAPRREAPARPSTAAPVEAPPHDFVAEANAATTHAEVQDIWRRAQTAVKAGAATPDTLDEVALIGAKLGAAEAAAANPGTPSAPAEEVTA